MRATCRSCVGFRSRCAARSPRSRRSGSSNRITSPGRLDRWTARLLSDNRFADYFAERLARSFVGTDIGQVVVFRRDRFVDWLRQQLSQNTPYDQVARHVISETGLWTDHPATNYITSAMADGELDENKLAGRTVRAFLGQRIDCAQCHDHPFAEWKQAQFQGLAALFGQTHSSLVGVEDKAKMKYEVAGPQDAQKACRRAGRSVSSRMVAGERNAARTAGRLDYASTKSPF